MRLDTFNKKSFDRGTNRCTEVIWFVIHALFFSNALPGSGWRMVLLRFFGAKIGKHVVIKPHVRVKFPWRLSIGEFSWIGESVWIDNLADVRIGAHCCVSQAAYLCTGNHDWSAPSFELTARPIEIKNQVWIGMCSQPICVARGILKNLLTLYWEM